MLVYVIQGCRLDTQHQEAKQNACMQKKKMEQDPHFIPHTKPNENALSRKTRDHNISIKKMQKKRSLTLGPAVFSGLCCSKP